MKKREICDGNFPNAMCTRAQTIVKLPNAIRTRAQTIVKLATAMCTFYKCH